MRRTTNGDECGKVYATCNAMINGEQKQGVAKYKSSCSRVMMVYCCKGNIGCMKGWRDVWGKYNENQKKEKKNMRQQWGGDDYNKHYAEQKNGINTKLLQTPNTILVKK